MRTKQRFEQLIHDCCVIYGNCGSGDLHISDLLPESGELSANQFACLMLKAERMTEQGDGEQYTKNFAWCADRFRSVMGSETIKVSEV